jgi:hypothetical protein
LSPKSESITFYVYNEIKSISMLLNKTLNKILIKNSVFLREKSNNQFRIAKVSKRTLLRDLNFKNIENFFNCLLSMLLNRSQAYALEKNKSLVIK